MFVSVQFITWIFLIWHLEQGACMNPEQISWRIFKDEYGADGKKNVIQDTDYEAEDTAKEELLFDVNFEFKSIKTASTSIPSSHQDIQCLCSNETGTIKKVFVCTWDNEPFYICLNNKVSSLKRCDSNDVLTRALCLNTSSKVVVICDHPTFTTCQESVNKSKMEVCHDPARFICLQKSPGYLETCIEGAQLNLSRSNQVIENSSQQYNYRMKEWMHQNRSDDLKLREMVRLCKTKEGILAKCERGRSNSPLCFGERNGEIKSCSNFSRAETHVPVCKEISKNEVVTCKSVPVSNLCWPTDNKTSIFRLCDDKFEHICLSKEGKIINCFNGSQLGNGTMSPSTDIEGFYGSHRSYGCSDLCFSAESELELKMCRADSANLTACLRTKDFKEWVLKPCRKIEVQKEVGISVCVQGKTEKITANGVTNPVNLCYGSSLLKPCESESSLACFGKDGRVKLCTNASEEDSHTQHIYGDTGIKEHLQTNGKGGLTTFKTDKHEKLCVSTEAKSKVVECQKNSNSNFACVVITNGEIHSCLKQSRELKIPICRNIKTKEIITCGRFSEVKLCFSNKSRESFLPCVSQEMPACFNEGIMRKCHSEATTERRARDTQMEMATETVNSTMPHLSDYQNVDSVYGVENRSIEQIMKGNIRICRDKVEEGVVTCDEDPSIQFLCFDSVSGSVDTYDNLMFSGLGIPLCMQNNTRKVMTCGKFSSAPLCHLNKTVKEICNEKDRQLCLTTKGKFKKCVDMKEEDKEEEEGEEEIVEERLKSEEKNLKEDEKKNEGETLEEELEKEAENLKEDEKKEEKWKKDEKKRSLRDDIEKDTEENVGGTTGQDDNAEVRAMVQRDVPHGCESPTVEDQYGKAYEDEYEEESPKGDKEEGIETEKNDGGNTGLYDYTKLWETPLDYYQQEVLYDCDFTTVEDQYGEEHEEEHKKEHKIEDEEVDEKGPEKVHKIEPEKVNNTEPVKTSNSSEPVLKVGDEGQDEHGEVLLKQVDFEVTSEHLKELKKKEERLIANVHMMSSHLCKTKREGLVNCNNDQQVHFVCVGAKSGQIKECSKFGTSEVALPICTQVTSNYLVTCDIISNVILCFHSKDSLVYCKKKSDYACLGEDGMPWKCGGSYLNKRDQHSKVESPENEKFFHLHCFNCTIENKMVIIGTPDDILPETELFTFPIDEY